MDAVQTSAPAPAGTILVIDDDPIYREVIRRMLTPLGLEILEAANGNEAIRIARERPISIALCDMFMPEKDGIETIRELRRIAPMPIIAMSGSDQSGRLDVLSIAEHLGAAQILRKPFTAANLVKALMHAHLACRAPRSDRLRKSEDQDGPRAAVYRR